MSTSTVSEFLEQMLMESGGFGRFQIVQLATILGSKISITWSLLMMAFAGATPNWWCQTGNSTLSDQTDINNASYWVKIEKSCEAKINGSMQTCPNKIFATDMSTVVGEWNLVCDEKWVASTVTSIQMAGLLLSGFLSGQLADVIGRRPTYFFSLIIMSASNIIAGFSTSWVMFAVMRFFIGLGCGMYLTVFYNYQIEFTPIRYRPLQIAIPDWSIWAACFGLVAWLLPNWSHLHIVTGVVTGMFLLSWWFIPESFRWLVSIGKLTEAGMVIKKIAKFNGKPVPKVDSLPAVVASDPSLVNGKKYTFLDVFRHREQLLKTVFAGIGWLSCGYGYYAISYGVEQLSGNLYLNMFLLSVVDIPALIATMFFNNKLGRRWTCFGFFIVGFISTMSVAISQIIAMDETLRGKLVNGFALAAKLGVSAAWGALMTFTVEIYPTVIRNLGYGIQNSVSRVGAMVAPQFVLISQDVTGVMYFLCGALMLLSAICCLFLPETKDKTILDTLSSEAGKSGPLDKSNVVLTDKQSVLETEKL
ncbi:hypothetical protein FSP39_015271 [Pinctada imbricata]|uniref:Major facilitator superfamily (MFS) profile domain-containing protein n=1 Tax=Pinctada imbricata TaxID=66713 RepID=A0AA88Y4V3_PINIB|nr:hypothetical protein FSP39_015271 [Pinctada imbricata]